MPHRACTGTAPAGVLHVGTAARDHVARTSGEACGRDIRQQQRGQPSHASIVAPEVLDGLGARLMAQCGLADFEHRLPHRAFAGTGAPVAEPAPPSGEAVGSGNLSPVLAPDGPFAAFGRRAPRHNGALHRVGSCRTIAEPKILRSRRLVVFPEPARAVIQRHRLARVEACRLADTGS